MKPPKRVVSASLDEDLAELPDQANAVVRAGLGLRERQRLLSRLLDQLDAEHDPVSEALIEKYVALLE